MSKYYSKMLLSILLLAALITGCSSSTEGVEASEKSANIEQKNAAESSESADTNVDSEKMIEDLRDESNGKLVFSNLRVPGNKPSTILDNEPIPIPGHKPCVEIRNDHVWFYAKPYESYRLIFENLDTSTPGYVEVKEELFDDNGWGDVNYYRFNYNDKDSEKIITNGINSDYIGVAYEIWWKSSKTSNKLENIGRINCSG